MDVEREEFEPLGYKGKDLERDAWVGFGETARRSFDAMRGCVPAGVTPGIFVYALGWRVRYPMESESGMEITVDRCQ